MHRHRQSCAAALLTVAWLCAPAAAAHDFVDDSAVAPLLEQPLAGLDGMVGTMITVTYPPGGRTGPHRHPGAHAFVYVLEGEIEMGVAGQPPVKLGPGQTFHESPADLHAVSRNASDSQPARFLVLLVHPQGEPVLVPAP